MEDGHLQQQQQESVLWTSAPDLTKRVLNPFHLPGGPPGVAGLAISSRDRLSTFQNEAINTLAALTAVVEQGLAQQDSTQPYHQQLANVDASDLHLPSLAALDQQGSARCPVQGTSAAPPPPPPPSTAAAPVSPAPDTADASTAPQPLHLPQMQHSPQLQHQLVPLQPQQGGMPASCPHLEACTEAAAAPMPQVAPAAVAAMPGTSAHAASSSNSSDEVLFPGQELVVTLQLFEAGRGPGATQQIMQELQLLGSNTLADVRDAIFCPVDSLAAGLGVGNSAAYFYLDSRFYDDTREAASPDCSKLVQKWAAAAGLVAPQGLLCDARVAKQQQQQQQQGEAATPGREDEAQQQLGPCAMQDTPVSALSLQVSNRVTGLFSHQGCCEHPVLVADVRLLHSTDSLLRSSYPRTTRRMSLARRYPCGVCRRQGGFTLLLHHPEAPEAAVMLCDRCEQLFDMSRYPQSQKVALAAGQS